MDAQLAMEGLTFTAEAAEERDSERSLSQSRKTASENRLRRWTQKNTNK